MPSIGIILLSLSSGISLTIRGLYFINWCSIRGRFIPLGIKGGGIIIILGIDRS